MYKYNKLLLSLNIIILFFVNNCYSYDTTFGTISSKQRNDKPIAISFRAEIPRGDSYTVFQPIGLNSSYAYLYKTPIDYLDHTMIVLNETCQITQNQLYPIFYRRCQNGSGLLENGPNISTWKYGNSKLTYDDESNTLMGLLDQKLYIYSISNDIWSTIATDPAMDQYVGYDQLSPWPTYFDAENRLLYTFGKSVLTSCFVKCNFVNQTVVVFDLNNNSSQIYWVTPTIAYKEKITNLGIVGRNGMIYISANYDSVTRIYRFNPLNNETIWVNAAINQSYSMITGYNSRYIGFVSYGGTTFYLYDIDKHVISIQNDINLFKYLGSTTLLPQYYFSLSSVIPELNKPTPPSPTPTPTNTPNNNNNNEDDNPNSSNSKYSLIVILLSLIFPLLIVLI